MNTIYLDYMASTPMDPRVIAKMNECFAAGFGNPASRHRFGTEALEWIETARAQVAALLHADPREIVWTSGATEAVNLALKGAAFFYQRKGKHLITLTTEHKAVLNTCAYLETQGFEVTYLNPGPDGVLDLSEFAAAIRSDTLLASVMWVNNETGVIQDIPAIAELTRRKGVLLHSDAAQAAGKIAINTASCGVDLLSFSAHKVYGPQGIGALYVRRAPRVRLQPQIHGGGQERGLRSGTLPTHQIAGMGEAFAIAAQEQPKDYACTRTLSAYFWQELQGLSGVHLNGPVEVENRVPHCLNVSIAGMTAESFLSQFPELALSSGSACHAAAMTPSHVLTAMGIDRGRALCALRFSFGRMTTQKEIDFALSRLKLPPFSKGKAPIQNQNT